MFGNLADYPMEGAMSKPEPQLFLSDARGIYIPRDFSESVRHECVTGVSDEDWKILEDPDHEHYWEVWSDVCDHAVVTDPASGVKYRVHQDGDCWLIPEGMEWSDKDDFFVWPVEEET